MSRTIATVVTTAVLGVSALAATACSANRSSANQPSGPSAGTGPISVKAGDKTCLVAASTLPAGRHRFEVTNTASQVTEVYVYAAGDQIVGEVENIGPATKRTLIVDLTAGDYQVACKPGMVGRGIRSSLTITGSAASGAGVDTNLLAAVTAYRGYVETETASLVDTTTAFAAAIHSGNLADARAAYSSAGGTTSARNRPTGGAEVGVRLPIVASDPTRA
jgi:iron uptake system component EfeO